MINDDDDKLDETTVEKSPRKFSIWRLLFRKPGAVIIWLNYMFPRSGNILVSARHRGNPIMEVLFSIVFWLLVLLFAAAYFGEHT